MARLALSRREQNKLEKRGRIIAAARALFAHKGFDDTTTQEIARAADIAIGTLFIYAKTKEDLLILVFHDEMLEVVEKAYEAGKKRKHLIDRFVVFFDTLLQYHERDLALARALLRQLGYVQSDAQRDAVRDLMRVLLRRLAMLIEAAKERDGVDAATPLLGGARAAFAVYYLHLGSLINGYINREQFDRDLRRQLALLLTGFGCHPSRD